MQAQAFSRTICWKNCYRKSLVDRIEDIGGSDDLEDYLYDRYGENNGEYEDKFYEEDDDVEGDNADDDNDENENNEDKTPSVKVMEMSDEDFKKFYTGAVNDDAEACNLWTLFI